MIKAIQKNDTNLSPSPPTLSARFTLKACSDANILLFLDLTSLDGTFFKFLLYLKTRPKAIQWLCCIQPVPVWENKNNPNDVAYSLVI